MTQTRVRDTAMSDDTFNFDFDSSAGGQARGGAIVNDTAATLIASISNCTLSKNQASGAAGFSAAGFLFSLPASQSSRKRSYGR